MANNTVKNNNDYDEWEVLKSNRRNFIKAGWTAEELGAIDAKAVLAHKFGYAEQDWARIKALASMQFCEEWFCDDEYEDIRSLLVFEEEDVVIDCPWMEDTGRYELTDEGALNFYGEDFLKS